MKLKLPWRKRFQSDERGAAVVEFALVAPIFALAVVIIGDGASLVLHYYDMRAAVSTAAQYVMVGGSDTSSIRSVAISSWTTRPDSGDVSVSSACLCGASTNACNTLCADQSVPRSYTTISATSSFSGTLISQALSAQQVVRVR
jgi:Flp pilus assembly protein TadG